VALIEVLIAMAILGSAGLAVVGVVREAIEAQTETNRVESIIKDADRVLSAVSLLRGNELDRAIGRQAVGAFEVTIQRPERGLYRLAVAERSAPDRQLLVTVVHRQAEPGR
jgi:type II secretory pathway pseudopilin PulG